MTAGVSNANSRIHEIFGQLQTITDRSLANVATPRVLEAGCGCFSRMTPQPTWHFSGIDISQQQLDRNTYVREKILGDVQTYPLPRESYNMIASWWVLEHLSDPQKALRNLAQALAPGGILLLAFPNVLSIKGMVTKLSPHWFHALIYRWIYQRTEAEAEGQALFKTYLRLSMSPASVKRFARKNSLAVVLFETYESDYLNRLRLRSKLVYGLWRLCRRVMLVVSIGRIDISQSECICVLKKETGAST